MCHLFLEDILSGAELGNQSATSSYLKPYPGPSSTLEPTSSALPLYLVWPGLSRGQETQGLSVPYTMNETGFIMDSAELRMGEALPYE